MKKLVTDGGGGILQQHSLQHPQIMRYPAQRRPSLFKKVPNYGFFRPFGCKTWVVKPPEKRTSNPNLFPHSRLPNFSHHPPSHLMMDNNDKNFSSARADDSHLESTTPSWHEDEVVREGSPLDHEGHLIDDDDDVPSSNEDRPPPVTRRLILRLHYKKICFNCHQSSIDRSNIIACCTRNAVAFSVGTTKPSNHARAMACDEQDQWKKAEEVKIANMISHNVWELIPLQPHHHTIPSTWAYKKKLGADNQVVKYKAHICAQGFWQIYGLNFELKYAPTGKPSSLWFLLSLACKKDLLIHQLDVKSAFLTCNLEEEVLMLPPAGYLPDQRVVLCLIKAIYGLKQASLAWYCRLSTFLNSIGFTTLVADPCVFWRESPSPLWIFSHVKDLIIIGSNPLFF
ncbi:hypothetical protein PCASD_08836 [Puccinia coronata f. sp. avenae]|uniref:Reverse transcriptase Ty1/copia-type domain-containing protein n=1 Tax=Puccinia coronata f. sp. avenae TaxID=200324 RepID=A0A2N5URY5_9BASI|nr:hypothetical protein PCASD_08836 [Puccinia coronata f. sp. avenae]